MKKLLLALLTLISISAFSQTTGYLRYDTVRIQRPGLNSTLIIENATRDTLGFLYNYGGGRTEFRRPRLNGDTLFFGSDTILLVSSNGFFSPDQTSTGNTTHTLGPNDFTISGNSAAITLNHTGAYSQMAYGTAGIVASQVAGGYAAELQSNSGTLIRFRASWDSAFINQPHLIPISDSADWYMTVTRKSTGAVGKAHWPGGGGGNLQLITDGGDSTDNPMSVYKSSPILSPNSDTIQASGYASITTTANMGATQNYYLINTIRTSRIRQTAPLLKVRFYLASVPVQLTSFYVQVWRKAGAYYNKVGEENILSQLNTGTNTYTLVNPFNVQEGDYIGVGWTGSGVPANFLSNINGALTNSYSTTTAPSSTEYNWEGQTANTFYLPEIAFVQAPVFVAIGNSIMAGHNSHWSYIEGTNTDNKESTIPYKVSYPLSLTYQNMGIGSQTTTQISARFSADVVALKPKYAIIEGGVNDVAAGVSTATIMANYNTMLVACTTNAIIPVVIKILPWTNGSNLQNQQVDEINDDIDALTASFPTLVVVDARAGVGQFRSGGDPGNLWDIQPYYDEDGVHFTASAHQVIADSILSALGATDAGTTVHGSSSITNNGNVFTFPKTAGELTVKGWSRNGTIAEDGDYIGTSNNVPLDFRTNSGLAARIATSGEILVNKTDDGGDFKLQIKGNLLIGDAVSASSIAAGNGKGAITSNTGFGNLVLNANTTGSSNTAIGYRVLSLNTTGQNNTGIGAAALANVTTSVQNVAVGNDALTSIQSAGASVAVGYSALRSAVSSNNNVAVGTLALNTATASNNTAIGHQNGYELTTGTYNISLGSFVQLPSNTATGQLNIGNVLYGTGLYSTAARSSTPTAAGSIGIGLTTPTARLMLPAGTATANTAPLKFTSGTNLTAPENGAVEYDGTHLYVTIAGVRHQLDQQSGSGVTTMGAIGSTPNANGATITGSTLNLEPASATFGGIVTTGTQSFAGTKSFGLISATGISTSGYYGATETGSISTPGSGIGFFWAKTDGTPNYTNDDGLAVNLVGRKTGTTASAATITPTGDAMQNHYTVTALATNPTFDPPSGTAVDQNTLLIRITDNGTSRTLTWNAIYDEGADIALPTATVISETMYLSFVYNSATSKWQLIGKTGGF